MLKTSDLNYRTLRNTENNFSKNTVEGIFVCLFPSLQIRADEVQGIFI